MYRYRTHKDTPLANPVTLVWLSGSYYITCITLDLQDQPTSTVSEPTCSSRRHPFTSMTCGPAIGPIDHYVGNGATQPTAPPTVEHLGMHDVSAHAALFARGGAVFKVGTFDYGVDRTRFLAVAAEDALTEVDVVSHGAPRAVRALLRLDSDRLCRTHCFT
ncbi:hypothetical protein SFRURICE_011056 [Spodoptera frugiperda]|nr:hypothetical protein SFRURICE_011056 [Spodoptera frugiperda]